MQALAVAVAVIPAEYRSARLEQLNRRNFSCASLLVLARLRIQRPAH